MSAFFVSLSAFYLRMKGEGGRGGTSFAGWFYEVGITTVTTPDRPSLACRDDRQGPRRGGRGVARAQHAVSRIDRPSLGFVAIALPSLRRAGSTRRSRTSAGTSRPAALFGKTISGTKRKSRGQRGAKRRRTSSGKLKAPQCRFKKPSAATDAPKVGVCPRRLDRFA